ncbi:DEAD/DEAH box helicase [Halostella sp. JP-L12]|uniref:DEAD/DEAH box helicase n=1 Tax=Halostella TaxID=1843185 RepID=UPI000EF7FFBF|nr:MULTISPECIES: DEAD/DEAH box helicase [Halostella]NHN46741.1 DEAD/DEAH box helicase [Halostella sp. JP-L12]
MHVGDLPLAPEFVEHYRERGIDELYPPQAAAVEAGVADDGSVVAAVPTASGKTFVAQLAMLTSGGTSLFIVPLRALATEKYEAFRDLPGVSVGIATGDFDSRDEELDEHDVVVATSEKVDSAIRNGAEWVENVGCAVVDEIHLLDSPDRGPTLEVTLAKLRRLTPDLQVVGLSATVANADEVADWLDAELVTSDWRPVDLRTGVYAGGAITFEDGDARPVPTEGDAPTVALVRDAVAEGGQCLVFVNSRRATQDLARDLADEELPVSAAEADRAAAAEEIRTSATTGTGTALADCAERGVAFHHAGLRSEHRTAVESAFRDRDLSVIVATPTLAAGVNVPARRVVVRDHHRYTDDGVQSLPVLEVHQMFGRAGRPHLDPYGEAVLVGDEDDAADLRERYIGAEPEAISSKLAREDALRTHVLATVASGFADSREDLIDVFESTFLAHMDPDADLASVTDDAVAYLDDAGMIDDGDDLAATDLGELVSQVYVDPLTGADVLAAIERATEMDRVTSLTVLELVCDTPDMRGSYVRNSEAGRLTQFAMDREAELTKPVADFDGDFQAWLGSLKTARMLDDWVHGEDAEVLSERYGVGPGDIRRTAERAEWLLNATESLAERVEDDGDVTATIRETRQELGRRQP